MSAIDEDVFAKPVPVAVVAPAVAAAIVAPIVVEEVAIPDEQAEEKNDDWLDDIGNFFSNLF